eukprot:maker-scaffold_1-snap-gene-8.9-mRNA-1 protein AED:0.14 eAED:0.14 QI:219/1/1/1/1/1/4/54/399
MSLVSSLLYHLQDDEDNATIDPCDLEDDETTSRDRAYSISINILVFFTVAGISSVVVFDDFKRSFREKQIYAGAAFQFLLMPFIGFLAVSIFPLDPLEAVALLILCASPGGSFSNWWCNLLNADLALSVSMTSLSTIASMFMLPLNIYLYITLAYTNTQDFDDDDDIEVDFADLGVTLGIVIGGIILGLWFGSTFPEHQDKSNLIGNVAGFASIALGVFASADTCDGKPPWRQPFYPLWIGTAFPLLVALFGVNALGFFLQLTDPQRVAIALETAYQNTSIALAYTVSQGSAGRSAAGVPVIYGGYEAGFFFLFMMGSWQLGWTYCPPRTPLLRTLFENWQPGSVNYAKLHPGAPIDPEELDKQKGEMKEKVEHQESQTSDEKSKKADSEEDDKQEIHR